MSESPKHPKESTTPSAEKAQALPQPTQGSAYLRRSSANKVIGGVAGGLGEYFAIDPTIIRVVFVLLFVFNGIGLLLYILLWLIMPLDQGEVGNGREQLRSNIDDLGQTVKQQVERLRTDESRSWIGWGLVIAGVLFLLGQSGILFWQLLALDRFWPLILVVLGILLLVRRK